MNRPASTRPGGFTLMEMMITMAVFIMLSAAIFGILTSVLRGASALQENTGRRDQVVALNEYLSHKLGALPAQSTFLSYRRGDGDGLVQNGIIFGADDLLTALDAKVQPNGYYTLRVALYVPPPANQSQTIAGSSVDLFLRAVASDDPDLIWSPIIRDVKTLSWKFQDPSSTQWVDVWNSGGAMPNMVQFSIQIAGDLQPATMDYWIPKLEQVTVNLPAASTNEP